MEVKCVLRKARAGDVAGLKRLWKAAFDDSDEYISAFFEHDFGERSSFAADCEGEIACAVHLLPAGFLHTENGPLSCVYAYALATLPEYRNKGLASRLASFAINASFEKFDINIIRPADIGLFPFYEKIGYAPFFSATEKLIGAGEIPPASGEGGAFALCKVRADEYAAAREKMLPPLSVFYDSRFLQWQDLAAADCDGGLFIITAKGNGASPLGCAAVEKSESGVFVKELLAPDCFFDAALSCIKLRFPAPSYLIRTPGGDAPFALAAFRRPLSDSALSKAACGYFSFVLD